VRAKTRQFFVFYSSLTYYDLPSLFWKGKQEQEMKDKLKGGAAALLRLFGFVLRRLFGYLP